MPDAPLKGWNHIPEVPIRVSPFFTLPLRPLEMARWIWNSWFLISEKLIVVGIAFLCYHYFHPPLEEAREFAFGWIAQIYVRNFLLMLFVAGSLHLYFYAWSKQGKKLKYDARPLMKNGRQFSFKDQVRDNMFWTLGSGVAFWTMYEALLYWAMANGHAPMLTWAANPVWFVLLFLFIPVWESFYFYWIHRFLHVPFLYRRVHAVHHRNINIGPWSGLSMHPVEHLIYLGSVMVHFIVAAHPVHILFHLQYYTLTAVTTHTGFEGLLVKDKDRLKLGTFHHQMHHRYFECNDWVQHILDCRGSIRLFDSRLRIFGCLRGFHCGFPPSGFPVSGGFGCARILERAQAWKACGQSFPGLFPGLASGARIVHSLPTPLLFGVVRGLAFLVFRCASSVESDGQSSADPFPCFGFGAWIAHTFHTFR